ncbi:MAG: FAD:protein FMN transferase [Planctomyces sp.]
MAESSPDEELRNSVTTSGRDQVPGQNAFTEQNRDSTEASRNRLPPSGGSTIRLSTSAMACEFSVIMNPGPASQIDAAGEVLECVHEIESWLSVYRSKSELSIVNERAGREQIPVSDRLFALLRSAMETWKITGGGFDMATGSLIQLWRRCRKEERIPTPDEIELARARSGSDHVELDEAKQTIRFQVEGLSLDPGAIGKGYALDECASWMNRVSGAPQEFLLHGGHSSLLARGTHNGLPGWPVGIGNPLFTERRLGTILLQDQAMATSGSNIQFFRYEGRRYGHILDPGTGWPVDGMLSVTAIAHSAALADAVSTAFFVLGIEKARQCCENLPGIGVILIPFPSDGKRVCPTVIGIPESRIFWDFDQVTL